MTLAFIRIWNVSCLFGYIVVKTTPRTVTPPTARVPPTATLKAGLNKGSAENNSHGNSASNAQIDDLSNQVIILSQEQSFVDNLKIDKI